MASGGPQGGWDPALAAPAATLEQLLSVLKKEADDSSNANGGSRGGPLLRPPSGTRIGGSSTLRVSGASAAGLRPTTSQVQRPERSAPRPDRSAPPSAPGPGLKASASQPQLRPAERTFADRPTADRDGGYAGSMKAGAPAQRSFADRPVADRDPGYGGSMKAGASRGFPGRSASETTLVPAASFKAGAPALSGRSVSSSKGPAEDLDALRARLTGVIGQPAAGQHAATLPSVPQIRITDTKFGEETPCNITTRTQQSDVAVRDRASNFVIDLVDTCCDLEEILGIADYGATVGPPVPSSSLPSARWTARAASAAEQAAEAASLAAQKAADASAAAAREAQKAAAAARAAAGRYNHIVDWVMTPGETASTGVPALEDGELESVVSRQDVASVVSKPEAQEPKTFVTEPEEPKPEEKDAPDEKGENSEEEGISQDKLETEKPRIKVTLNFKDPVGPALWQLMLVELDLDPDEGMDIYVRIKQEVIGKGLPVPEDGFPLSEYLEELRIEMDDKEGLLTIEKALATAKDKLAKGESAQRRTDDKSSVRTMFDKVVKACDRNQIQAADAWNLLDKDKVPLSAAESEVIRQWQDRRENFVKRVARYMIEPPLVNANAGQTLCKQRCLAEVNAHIKRCQTDRVKFKDPDWDLKSSAPYCLYVDEKEPGYDCTVTLPAGYKRLTEIVKNSGGSTAKALGGLFGSAAPSGPKPVRKPMLFKGGVKAGDIVQGQIGTCFLLGAMGAIASKKEDAIESLFIKYDVDVGIYGIRFNVDGEWIHVVIDDIMPVDENGDLLYARCKDPQEVWVPLLEKAYCKLHKCYEMCDGGQAPEAIFSFFGGVNGRFMVKRQHKRDPKRYYKLIENAYDKGWLMTTSFVPKKGATAQAAGKCGEAVLPTGLVGGHAYSVLKVVEAHGHKLVCCRNPWGTGEWTGKWSDRNAYGEWTQEMKKATGYQGLDDGKFWMSIEDFVDNTGGVDYARTFGPNWKKITQYKQFSKKKTIGTALQDFSTSKRDELSFAKGDKIEITTCSEAWWSGKLVGKTKEGFFPGEIVEVSDRPIARFDLTGTPNEGLEGPMTAVVLLMQPNVLMKRKYSRRKQDGLNYKETTYGRLQLCIVGPDGSVALRKGARKRCVWGELTLPGGGLWRIYALSVDGAGGDFILRVYVKDGTAKLREVSGAKFMEYTGKTPPLAPAPLPPLEDEKEEEEPEDAAAEAEEEGLDQNALETEKKIELTGVDLEQPISAAEWQVVLQILGLDPDEGKDLYVKVRDEMKQKAPTMNTARGFPIKEFLEELRVELDDLEGVQAVVKAVTEAKARVRKGESASTAPMDRSALKTMFDKVVKALDMVEGPAEDAWKLVDAGKVAMSKAETEVLETWKSRRPEFVQKVAHYMLEPPVLNSNAGQTVCNQKCIAEVTNIINKCHSEGTKYEDPSWNMTTSAAEVLYVDKQKPGYDCTVGLPVAYKRLSDIVKSKGGGATTKAIGSLFGGMSSSSSSSKPKPVQKPVLFKGGVQAGDICQGQIGTCFLLGAIGAIASNNEAGVEKLFIKHDVDVGVYGIRFNVMGEWQYVIVDDYFPVDENGELLYARCKDPQEVWVPLLEKAYCKLHTCFEMCDGGQASEAIFSFFGGVNGKFQVKKIHRRDPKRYFNLLQNARSKGWLLTTAFVPHRGAKAAGAGKCGEAMLPCGLVGGHAYSVLKVVEAHGNQLVCCRNPWGTGEWTGKWSDENAYGEWTKEMKKATGYQNLDDGKFWMSIEDFVANTGGVDYARTFGPNWKKVTQYARFQKRALIATAQEVFSSKKADELSFNKGDQIEVLTCSEDWWSGRLHGSSKEGFFPGELVQMNERPVARFDLKGSPTPGTTGPMTAVVMLLQPNACLKRKFYKRKQDGLNYKDTKYSRMQLCVIGPDNQIAIKKGGQKRCVWGELQLPGGGLWRIYALSLDGSGSNFSLRVYLKDGTAILREVQGASIAETTGGPAVIESPLLHRNVEEEAKAELTKPAAKPGATPPAAAPAAEKPAAAAKPATPAAEKPAAPAAVKPAEAAKPATPAAEKPAAPAAVKPAEVAATKPAERPVEKPESKPFAKPAEEDENGEDDGIDQEKMENEKELLELGFDVGQLVGPDLWQYLLHKLDLDPVEGADLYVRIEDEMLGKGLSKNEKGYPLREFLEELKIDLDDRDGVETACKAIEEGKEKLARGEKVGVNSDRSAQRTMFDKVVKNLDNAERPAGDAWKIIEEGGVAMSKAEVTILETWKSRKEEFIAKVEEYMIVPPLLASNAGQTVCNQKCAAAIAQIVKTCKENGTKFKDTEWDIKGNPEHCLYVDKTAPGYDCTVGDPAGYKRLTTIVKDSAPAANKALGSLFGGMGGASAPKPVKKPVLFKGGVKAGDVVQGQIGTCFLLGAIGTMASNSPEAIERMFIKYDVDVGVYGVRFNINGEWWYVIVDDIMPVDEDGQLLYARCNDPQEVWVPLLEKAYCKLMTCYEMCDGGIPSEAVFSFLGGVNGRFLVRRNHQRNPALYFKLLKQARAKGWLLTTGFKQQKGGNEPSGGRCGEPISANGLVAGHAYSVLKVVEAHGQQLVCCRNPWGQGEWLGKWSDKNAFGEWTQEMKAATGYLGLNDGKFWMSIDDFVKNSTGVDYARTFGPNWKKTTHYKRFLKKKMLATVVRDYDARKKDELSIAKGDQIEIVNFTSDWWSGRHQGNNKEGVFPGECAQVNDRPVARFDLVGTPNEGLEGPMTAVVMLMQPNALMKRQFHRRREDGMNYKDTSYPNVQLMVVAPDNSVAIKKEGKKRCVWGELELPGGGLWRIYALSTDGKGGKFIIRVYVKDGTCALKEIPEATFSEISEVM